MSEIPGSRLKVRFKGQVIKCQRATVDDVLQTGDITHSELPADEFGVVRKAVLGTTGQATVTLINASYDPEENQFAAPIGMSTGATGELFIHPDGLTSEPWVFTDVLVTQGTHDFDVNNLQPVTIRLMTNGIYYSPGNAP